MGRGSGQARSQASVVSTTVKAGRIQTAMTSVRRLGVVDPGATMGSLIGPSDRLIPVPIAVPAVPIATTAHAGSWPTTRVSTSGGTTSAPNQRAVTNITQGMDLV